MELALARYLPGLFLLFGLELGQRPHLAFMRRRDTRGCQITDNFCCSGSSLASGRTCRSLDGCVSTVGDKLLTT